MSSNMSRHGRLMLALSHFAAANPSACATGTCALGAIHVMRAKRVKHCALSAHGPAPGRPLREESAGELQAKCVDRSSLEPVECSFWIHEP